MGAMHERLRKAREELHLSQEYVAKHLGINRSAVAEIEAGRRKVSAEELGGFSELFLLSADEIIHGPQVETPAQVFARSFEALDEIDQDEILNLMKFKRAMRESQ